MTFTEKNIKFQVAYTVSEYWDFTEVNGEFFEWDGDQKVEQTMYGVLDVRQFLWLIFDKELEESMNTQGLQIKTGHIIPAVDFYTCDEDRRCYVSVYTEELLKEALSQSDKPTPTPVLQNDFSLKDENLSFVRDLENWNKVVEGLPEIVESLRKEEDFYDIDDEILDRMIPKLLEKLNEISQTEKEQKL